MPSLQTGRGSACELLHLPAGSQGRPRRLDGRLPCETGLASYLSSCVSFTNGRHCFQHCPWWEFLHGCGTLPSRTPRQPRVATLPFRVPFAKRNLAANALYLFREPAENVKTHWLAVTTSDRSRSLRSFSRSKPNRSNLTRLAAGFSNVEYSQLNIAWPLAA